MGHSVNMQTLLFIAKPSVARLRVINVLVGLLLVAPSAVAVLMARILLGEDVRYEYLR